jgi:hypothetical protein
MIAIDVVAFVVDDPVFSFCCYKGFAAFPFFRSSVHTGVLLFLEFYS